MKPEAQDRLAKIGALQQGLQASWTTLKPYIEQIRSELIENLVSLNNEETRGRIKQLDELLALPDSLQVEAQHLSAPQQEEGDLP